MYVYIIYVVIYILKGGHQKVITIQIRYTKRCLLKGYNSSYLIYIKCAYWPKRCLLKKNVFIDRKCIYLMKICLLKSYDVLSINSGSYSFGNFFLISSLSYFLDTQETCGSFPKLLFVSYISLLNSKNVQKSSHTNGGNNNNKRFLHLVTFSQLFIFNLSLKHTKHMDLFQNFYL